MVLASDSTLPLVCGLNGLHDLGVKPAVRANYSNFSFHTTLVKELLA